MARADSRGWSVVTYTLLRVGVFVVFWLPLQFLTPLRGLLAVVTALLMSGAVSLILLDRQRGRAGQVVERFFHGINERIDASTRAEDDLFDESGSARAQVSGGPSADGSAADDARAGEQRAGEQAVDQ